MKSKRKPFKKIYCEICGACNLRCDFCPISKNPRGLMDKELFSKIVRQVSPYGEAIYLHVMGEPLLHPQFDEFINICAEHDLRVHLVTNGLLLRDDKLQTMLKPIIREINISLQSFAGSHGEDGDVDGYLEHIREFCLYIEQYRPDMKVNLRIWNLSDYSANTLAENRYFQWLVKSFDYKIPEVIIDQEIHSRGMKISNNLCVNFSRRFAWPSMHNPEIRTRGYCPGLTQQLGILSDGRVVPCCLDDDGSVELGNMVDQDFLEIIQGERANIMLAGLEAGVLTESFCRRCEFGARFKSKVKRLPF